MKKQVVPKRIAKKTVTIIDERTPSPPPPVSPDVAIRTVLYVEAGSMQSYQMAQLVSQVSEMYKGNRAGMHYILPIRNGKIGADIFFEEEWLKVVRAICEVDADGMIVLKDGAKEIKVNRETIND